MSPCLPLIFLSNCFRTPLRSPRDSPGGPAVETSSSSAGGAGLIPGQGARIPHASQPKTQNMKQKQYFNKFCKDFKKSSHQLKKKKKKKESHLVPASKGVRLLPDLVLESSSASRDKRTTRRKGWSPVGLAWEVDSKS